MSHAHAAVAPVAAPWLAEDYLGEIIVDAGDHRAVGGRSFFVAGWPGFLLIGSWLVERRVGVALEALGELRVCLLALLGHAAPDYDGDARLDRPAHALGIELWGGGDAHPEFFCDRVVEVEDAAATRTTRVAKLRARLERLRRDPQAEVVSMMWSIAAWIVLGLSSMAGGRQTGSDLAQFSSGW